MLQSSERRWGVAEGDFVSLLTPATPPPRFQTSQTAQTPPETTNPQCSVLRDTLVAGLVSLITDWGCSLCLTFLWPWNPKCGVISVVFTSSTRLCLQKHHPAHNWRLRGKSFTPNCLWGGGGWKSHQHLGITVGSRSRVQEFVQGPGSPGSAAVFPCSLHSSSSALNSQHRDFTPGTFSP